MSRSRRSTGAGRQLGAALVTVMLALCACAAPPPSKGSPRPAPRALKAVTYFPSGYPSGDVLDHLTAALGRGSAGLLTIAEQPHLETFDAGTDALNAVRAGTVDLAVVPTRVFDLQGVTSFQALQAPLVVTSTEQTDALIDDPIAATMLAPVTALGVVGLGLTWDALRNMKGYWGLLVTPTQFAGRPIAFRPSAISDSVVKALGAKVPVSNSDFVKAIKTKQVYGLEDSINQPNEQHIGTTVGNEFFSFKANAIVVNKQVWDGLSPTQQAWLTAAVDDARVWSHTKMIWHMDLATAAQQFCAGHNGDVVVASPQDVAAMQAAVAPVIAHLRQDPLNNEVIDRFMALGQAVREPRLAQPCTNVIPQARPWTAVTPHGDQTVLDGTWRSDVSAESMIAMGVDVRTANDNAGLNTFTIHDGTMSTQHSQDSTALAATVTIDGDRVSIVNHQEDGSLDEYTATWSRDGDKLMLTDFTGPTDETVTFYTAFFATPPVRIAGP